MNLTKAPNIVVKNGLQTQESKREWVDFSLDLWLVCYQTKKVLK